MVWNMASYIEGGGQLEAFKEKILREKMGWKGTQ
jgi:hypothetical protein